MNKVVAVLADTDEEYISALEYKLLEEWRDTVELLVITQAKYCQEFFSQPRTIDVLLIHERLYTETVQKQNCRHVFLLCETEVDIHFPKPGVVALPKYSGLKALYAQIMREIRIDPLQQNVEKTELYLVYSPAGGCGKTLCALGLCQQLAGMGERVLYLNTESVQDFSYYLGPCPTASAAFCYSLGNRQPDISREVLPEIERGEFDFLRPLERALSSYQATEKSIFELARRIQMEKRYDRMVVEVSLELDDQKSSWMEWADRVFVVTMADARSVYKLEAFLKNIVYSRDKFWFIGNREKAEGENCLHSPLTWGEIVVCERIPELEDGPMTLKRMEERHILRRTAYALE